MRSLPYSPSPTICPEPMPMGEMPLAPYALTRMSEAELARAMVRHLTATAPVCSTTEALKALRRAFPHSPLTARVAALSALSALARRDATANLLPKAG